MAQKIESLVQYMELVEQLEKKKNEKEDVYNIYYRGENKKFDERIPGIYRGHYNKLLKSESKNYYLEIFEELGWPIRSFGSKIFEQIVEVQHYGAVTNILDLSTNPLVGLFFACYDNSQDNGMIYVYSSDTSMEKHYFDREISIRTALNFIDRTVIERFLKVFDAFKKMVPKDSVLYRNICNRKSSIENIKEALDKEFFENITNKYNKISKKKQIEMPFIVPLNTKASGDEDLIKKEEMRAKGEILDYLNRVDKKYKYKRLLNSQYKEILKLESYQNIMKEYMIENIVYFLEEARRYSGINDPLDFPYAIYEDMRKSYVVKSSKINERIKNQRGAFIVPRYIHTTEKKIKDIQEEVSNSIKDSVNVLAEIEVPNDKKMEILKQLKYIGIDEGFIYPEISYIAKTVSERYR